jgi:HEAT repeat protein
VKECALRVLNEIRNMDPVAIEPISKLLTNRNRVIRSYAITSLGKIKDARIAEPLLRAYNDLDWRDQVLIVNAFADLGEPAFNGLVIALKSKYSEIRKIAERGLRKIRDDKEVERLVKVAEYERSISQEQPKISKEKIPPNTPPEIKQQIERLYSKDQNEQGNAIYRLGEQKIIAAIPFLVDLLSATQTFQHDDDSYESLGLAAARALGSIGRPALPKLIVALHSDNIFIKTNAAFALGFIEDSESIKALIDSLNSSDDYLRTVIANSLTKTTGKNFGQNQKKWQDWWTKESNR